MGSLNRFFFLIASTYLLVASSASAEKQSFVYHEVRILTPQQAVIVAEVSDTPEKREQGLGFREHLAPGRGMLFIFDEKKERRFWMKNMSIAIDIIWLDNHRIVHIEHDVPPPQNPNDRLPVYRGKGIPVNFALELAAGQAKHYQLQVGQKLRYQW